MEKIITGFHAIEETISRAQKSNEARAMSVSFSKTGPRAKRIIAVAQGAGVPCARVSDEELDRAVSALPQTARDHRGIILRVQTDGKSKDGAVDFSEWLRDTASQDERQTVVLLDSITDLHNVGAIVRSCDQFGVSLVILPERRSASGIARNETVARSSAGASAWIPSVTVTNLARCARSLKEAGFWIYGADSSGERLDGFSFARKSAIALGSEGSGLSRALAAECDSIVSIPTCGKIDSLNVSVAAGILLYSRFVQKD